MRSWLTIIVFACSHVANAAAWSICPVSVADPPALCCCCEPGNCPCPCVPPPTDDPQPQPTNRAVLCSCDDQPVPLSESQRPVIERLSELQVNEAADDTGGFVEGDRSADAYPQAHGPPPHLAFVRTFILLT